MHPTQTKIPRMAALLSVVFLAQCCCCIIPLNWSTYASAGSVPRMEAPRAVSQAPEPEAAYSLSPLKAVERTPGAFDWEFTVEPCDPLGTSCQASHGSR